MKTTDFPSPLPVLKWRERLQHIETESAWRARLEARVLRFLVRRYGEAKVVAMPHSPLWISWRAFVVPAGRVRLAPRDLLHKLRRIARINREVRVPSRTEKPGFWASAFLPTGQFWLDVELRTLGLTEQERQNRERNALQRERERQFAARMRQRRYEKQEQKQTRHD